eukprot:4975210-Amphidinium_carterae.1
MARGACCARKASEHHDIASSVRRFGNHQRVDRKTFGPVLLQDLDCISDFRAALCRLKGADRAFLARYPPDLAAQRVHERPYDRRKANCLQLPFVWRCCNCKIAPRRVSRHQGALLVWQANFHRSKDSSVLVSVRRRDTECAVSNSRVYIDAVAGPTRPYDVFTGQTEAKYLVLRGIAGTVGWKARAFVGERLA